MLSERSIKIRYNDLVLNPDITLRKVFKYLDLEYEPNLIEKLSNNQLKGRMGDHGINRYSGVSTKSLEKWKETLGTKYRRTYARKYLTSIGEEIHRTYGYDLQELLTELVRMKIKSNKYMFMDRLHVLSENMDRIINWPMQKKRIKERIKKGRRFYLYT